MAYPPHYLLSFGGTFVSDPNEIWSNNLRFAKDDNVDGAQHTSYSSAQIADILTVLVDKLSPMVGNPDGQYPTNVRMTYVKLNEIGPDGRYASQSESHTRLLGGTGVTGPGTSTHSLSTAMALSFLTDKERGRGSRGRIFIPQPAVALGSDYRIPSAKCSTIVAYYVQRINGLNDWNLGVASGTQPKLSVLSKLGEGSARNVRRVEVGNVLDHMQSRRNRLVEARTTSAVLTSV